MSPLTTLPGSLSRHQRRASSEESSPATLRETGVAQHAQIRAGRGAEIEDSGGRSDPAPGDLAREQPAPAHEPPMFGLDRGFDGKCCISHSSCSARS